MTSLPTIQVGADVERNARAHLLHRTTTAVPGSWSPQLARGECVALVLTWRNRVGIFKRSQRVGSDRGRWHCITGHLDPGRGALEQAVQELHEETGLGVADLDRFDPGPVLVLADPRGGWWRVHTFRAATRVRRLELNWEHDAYRWVAPARLRRFDGQVPWLGQVLDVTLG